MQLKHIDIAKLALSAANMRAKGGPDIANILPSVRARGILVPSIVRASRIEAETTERSKGNCNASPEHAEGAAPETFEIVVGKRRYHAALSGRGLERGRGARTRRRSPAAGIFCGEILCWQMPIQRG